MVWAGKYERHLSAFATLAGFVSDAFFFERVDLLTTQLLFLAYGGGSALLIAWLHSIESRRGRGKAYPRYRPLLPLTVQFLLGGFLSGTLVVYGKSAVLGVSWPFLFMLAAALIGNEFLHRYRERLVFSSLLFFLALYAYAIFTLPVFMGSIGTAIFLLSSASALALFSLFLLVLRSIGRDKFAEDMRQIRRGSIAILALIVFSYSMHILPPLPLALTAGDLYALVEKKNGEYIAHAEEQSWVVRLGASPTVHLAPGEPLYAYSAVFAPTRLATTIVHRWQYQNPRTEVWETVSVVSFPIAGGRDGGYRGYSMKLNPRAGMWRVNVETREGRVVGRMTARVIPSDTPPVYETRVLD